VASWIIYSRYIGFPGRKTGEPELKVIPACWPKYQLLNSPWEKQMKGNRKKTQKIQMTLMIGSFVSFNFISKKDKAP
jgi:hypothetical protein